MINIQRNPYLFANDRTSYPICQKILFDTWDNYSNCHIGSTFEMLPLTSYVWHSKGDDDVQRGR